MKTTKMICCVLIITIVCSLEGCGFFGEQRYTCDIENIKLIQIIKLGDYNEETLLFNHTVICEIDDHAAFAEKLLDIKQSVNWGDPGSFHTGDIAIYIEYLNGDFDRISATAQTKVRDGKGAGGGYIFFNKKQFAALLNDYLPENEQIAVDS